MTNLSSSSSPSTSPEVVTKRSASSTDYHSSSSPSHHHQHHYLLHHPHHHRLHHHHHHHLHPPSSASPAVITMSYVDHVIMEIVETERSYVNDLRDVIHGYQEYLMSKTTPTDPSPTVGDQRILLTPETLTALFGNIKDLYDFSHHFLTQLDTCRTGQSGQLDVVSIAETFMVNSVGFDVYTEFCTVHYPKSLGILSGLMRDAATAGILRDIQVTLGHSLPLGSYLLKPVQRILKYPLLLHNLVSHMTETDEGYSVVKEAHSLMTNYASHINDMKRRHEHDVRVQEVQSLLKGWQGQDLTTFGELLQESSFKTADGQSRRFLFLFEKILLITKKSGKTDYFYYKDHIESTNLMLVEGIPGHPMAFSVIPFDNPRAQVTVEARNCEEKRKFCLLLKQVMLDNFSAVIPTAAKQAILASTSVQDSVSPSCQNASLRRRLSAPEYLEKRHNRKSTRSPSTSGPNSRKAMDMIHASLGKGFRLRRSLRRMYSSGDSDKKAEKQQPEPEVALAVKMRRLRIDEDEGFRSMSNRNSIISVSDVPDILNVCPPPQTFVPRRVGVGRSSPPEEDDQDFDVETFSRNGRIRSSCLLSRKVSSATVDSGLGSESGHLALSHMSAGSSSLSMASSNISTDSDLSHSGHSSYVNYYFGPMLRRVQSFSQSPNGPSPKSTLRQLTHTESFKLRSPKKSLAKVALRASVKNLSIVNFRMIDDE